MTTLSPRHPRRSRLASRTALTNGGRDNRGASASLTPLVGWVQLIVEAQ